MEGGEVGGALGWIGPVGWGISDWSSGFRLQASDGKDVIDRRIDDGCRK